MRGEWWSNRHCELNELGWSDWFEQRAECGPTDTVARVAAVDRDQLLLVDQTGPFRARLAGRYLHRHHLSHELPCVGDWVCVEKQPGDGFGVVHALMERRTSLRRKSAGSVIEYQMIAANVDYVVIVQSCHFDFNLKRLERYLVMVMDGGAEPHILLTKTDLVEFAVLTAQLAEIRSAGITAPIATLSNVTQDGVDDFKRVLVPGKTYCFVGSSGVGKSTLINQLIGHEMLETKAVSGTGEGRHTTVSSRVDSSRRGCAGHRQSRNARVRGCRRGGRHRGAATPTSLPSHPAAAIETAATRASLVVPCSRPWTPAKSARSTSRTT